MVDMVKSIPQILFTTLLTQDNLTTFQLAQKTFCILLPHKGSLADKEMHTITPAVGKIQAQSANFKAALEFILL